MSAEAIAAIYCLLIVAASLIGGWIPLRFRLSHAQMQIALSFVAGVMLGVGILHLLPHGYLILRSIDRTVWWVLVGFMVVFFMERVFAFHHHDAPAEHLAAHSDDAPCGHDHAGEALHAHHHHQNHEHHRGSRAHQVSWGGAAIGLTLHSLIDGMALGAAVLAEWSAGSVLAGLGIFLAIFLHKPFDSLTIGTLMAASHSPDRQRHLVNFAYALVAPIGTALFLYGFGRHLESAQGILGCALGFAAGAFICIATSDLLPELQFHSHDRLKLSVSLLLGIGLAWAILLFETTGHDHSEPAVQFLSESMLRHA